MIIELSQDPIVSYSVLPFPIPKTLPDSAPYKVEFVFIRFSSPIWAFPPIYIYVVPFSVPSPFVPVAPFDPPNTL